MEAFSANGGGVSMTFKAKPPPLQLKYRDKHGVASTEVGPLPISDDPAAELTVFQFDPDKMDFNIVPQRQNFCPRNNGMPRGAIGI
jgi:hypothetical protein